MVNPGRPRSALWISTTYTILQLTFSRRMRMSNGWRICYSFGKSQLFFSFLLYTSLIVLARHLDLCKVIHRSAGGLPQTQRHQTAKTIWTTFSAMTLKKCKADPGTIDRPWIVSQMHRQAVSTIQQVLCDANPTLATLLDPAPQVVLPQRLLNPIRHVALLLLDQARRMVLDRADRLGRRTCNLEARMATATVMMKMTMKISPGAGTGSISKVIFLLHTPGIYNCFFLEIKRERSPLTPPPTSPVVSPTPARGRGRGRGPSNRRGRGKRGGKRWSLTCLCFPVFFILLHCSWCCLHFSCFRIITSCSINEFHVNCDMCSLSQYMDRNHYTTTKTWTGSKSLTCWPVLTSSPWLYMTHKFLNGSPILSQPYIKPEPSKLVHGVSPAWRCLVAPSEPGVFIHDQVTTYTYKVGAHLLM